MPILGGKYVNPGWANGTQPYINASELNDMSDTLEQVPVENGGTGATTPAGARANLGVLPATNFQSKGSNDSPVYFNANGEAVGISTLSTQLDSDYIVGTVYKVGKLVMITGTTAEKVTTTSISEFIPEGYRPVQQAYGYAFGVNSTSASAEMTSNGVVSINTNGTIRLSLDTATNYYIRFSITYLSA